MEDSMIFTVSSCVVLDILMKGHDKGRKAREEKGGNSC
jgi:hypothetical protein